MNASLPGDVIRTLSKDELPDSVREIDLRDVDSVLMAHQVQWVKQIHSHDLNIGEKGRRTGITWATAQDDAISASSNREAGGDNVYYIGDTKDKGLEYIGYVAHTAKIMAMAMAEGWQGIEVFLFEDQQEDGSTRNITSYRIRFASGFRVVALSSNPANIRGLQGIVNIDEAAFHQNVKAVIDAALALLIWGGKIRIISTHNGDQNPFNELIKDARAGRNAFKVFRVTFDNAVANGLYERVCLVKGWNPTPEGKTEWYQRVRGGYGSNRAAMLEELDAVPRESSGVAIPTVLVERVMREERPIVRLSLNDSFALKSKEYKWSWCKDWIEENIDPLFKLLDPALDHYFGSDYARHADFAVMAPLAKTQNLRRICPFMLEFHNVPTRQQEQVLWHVIRNLPRFRAGAMDATGNGQTIAEYTADEFGPEIIHQVTLNDSWYRENMGAFEDAFTDDMIDLPRDKDVLNDIRTLERIKGIIKLPDTHLKDSKDGKLKRHGDSAIALALAWFATLQDGVRDTEILSGMPRESTSMLAGY